jgi:hypothetical protein
LSASARTPVRSSEKGGGAVAARYAHNPTAPAASAPAAMEVLMINARRMGVVLLSRFAGEKAS